MGNSMSTAVSNVLNPALNFSSLVELLRYRAIHQSNQIAYTFLVDGETQEICITYQELDCKARSIATHLQYLNVRGERALLLYQPGLEYIVAFFGCLYAGVVAVPAYPPRPNKPLPRLQAIVADAKAKVILTTTSILANIEQQLSHTPDLLALHRLATNTITSDSLQEWQQPQIGSETLAFLQYTSGSTGTPKGVMVSHGNLLHNQRMIQTAMGNTEKTISVGWLPLFHDMGLIGNMLQSLYLGIPCIFMSPVDFIKKPFRWLHAISYYKATTSGGPNFAYDLACRNITPEQRATLDLSSWDVAFNGAEPLRAQTLDRFITTFEPCGFRREAFYPCYGMAESTLLISGGLKTQPPAIRSFDGSALEQNRVVAANNRQEGNRVIVGCGQSCLDEQIAIVDPESLTRCAADQIGEIWVSSPSVAQGYWNQPVQTQNTFQAYEVATGQGPFLRTGDLGFLQNGELFVTGRLKDLIIILGRNHYPQDIELTVEQCHSALRPSCGAAFSVENADGEKLVIVQEVERNYLRHLKANEAFGAIRRAIAEQHNLQAYAILLLKTGSLPKTSSGKVQRNACRAGFLAGTLDVVEDWSANPQNLTKFRSLKTEVESLLESCETS
jgi:acyl-CoA synthetase (AMP-forming)/AMP-acid ligase II